MGYLSTAAWEPSVPGLPISSRFVAANVALIVISRIARPDIIAFSNVRR